MCTVMTRLIGFLFLFENGLFDYSIKRIYEKFMEVLARAFHFSRSTILNEVTDDQDVCVKL